MTENDRRSDKMRLASDMLDGMKHRAKGATHLKGVHSAGEYAVKYYDEKWNTILDTYVEAILEMKHSNGPEN